MEIRKLLPIGSVVKLKSAGKRLMIFGIRQTNKETGEEYDYIGVLYPEGNVGEKGQFLFRHESIETVCFRGYEDEERQKFLLSLEQFYRARGGRP